MDNPETLAEKVKSLTSQLSQKDAEIVLLKNKILSLNLRATNNSPIKQRVSNIVSSITLIDNNEQKEKEFQKRLNEELEKQKKISNEKQREQIIKLEKELSTSKHMYEQWKEP